MSNSSFAPIAIVGMACRFPKGLHDLNRLWDALKSKFSAIDTVPQDRWTADRYYSSNNISKGKAYIRRGGFLTHDVSQFDAAFFGISPRDAENMDPQQRLLLEVVWEAFENGGIPLPQFAGKNVGVYVGGFMLDHMITQMSASNRSQINQNTAAGMMMTMLSNRISHTFDLRGPSLSIDTACSSSLVAFNYACQDLWSGLTEMAIVGGANCMLRPEYPMGMCKGHFLSRDGECKSFDSRADGYGRGEGAGAVLLKPLEKALADGDQVLACVIGAGSNQDGRTPGISMPRGEAQQALIEKVCQRFDIDARQIRYVECHGTGTAIGDPTEASAIGATYGIARRDIAPVVIGSVKSNIGHLEAAAGVAGIIKAVLTLINREATPVANLLEPNPAIKCDENNLRIADTAIQLAEPHESFCVAINSFGYGGSNAHVILQSAPVQSVVSGTRNGCVVVNRAESGFPYCLPISGKGEKACNALATRYLKMLRGDVNLDDLLYSASHKRAHLSHRLVVMGDSREALMKGLEAVVNGEESDYVVRGTEPFNGHRKPVFVFTGMGPQWWAMGQELYRDNQTYRNAVIEADGEFQAVSGFSALAEMLRPESDSRITMTEYAQPANLLIQIGLLAILRASGVEPGAVVGHSVGELGSAYAADVLSLRDVMTVCYHRSQLQATCKGTGSMLAVGLSPTQVDSYIQAANGKVSIAAVNGSANITLAGDTNAIDEIAATLNESGIFHKKLEVEVPYHSPLMDPIMQPLAEALAGVKPSNPSIPLYSTVTGTRVEGVSYGADYWPLNIRQSVEFAPAITALIEDGYSTFVEVGPHPVLATSLKDCIKVSSKDCRTTFTLRRNTPETIAIYRSVMSVYAMGCDIDWSTHHRSGKFIALPNYPWQREKYWLENDRAVQDRIAPIDHPILGIQEAPGSPVWRNDFDHEPVAYLRDHVVTGMPVLPAAAYIEAVLELAQIQYPNANTWSIRGLEILAPMIIGADRGLDCVTSFDPTTQRVTIRGLENGRLGTGQPHISATLVSFTDGSQERASINMLKTRFQRDQTIDQFYRTLDLMGLSYGPAFQTVKELKLSEQDDEVLARIEVVQTLQSNLSLYCVHPTLLDACFQTLIAMLGESENMYLPTGFKELNLYARHLPANIWCHAKKTYQDTRHIDCDLTLMDEAGHVLMTIRGMRSTAASKRERRDQFGDRVKRQILAYQWGYGETLTEPKRLGYWMLVGESNEMADDLMGRFEHYGAQVVARVSIGDAYSNERGRFTVRPNSTEDATRLFLECGELDGVAFLHGLDATSMEHDVTGAASISQLVTMIQGMERAIINRKPRAYVITRNAFQVGEHDEAVNPSQTALNGFTRVAFNELDGYRFSSIDIPSGRHFDIVESLTLELLCDAEQDEVAIRGNLRLVSELLESAAIDEDRIAYQELADDAPVLVRPVRPEFESIGTARVVESCLETEINSLNEYDAFVRVEASVVPPNLLLDPSSDSIDQPVIEIIGRVLAATPSAGIKNGERFVGFVPADLSSHLRLRGNDVIVVAINETVEPSLLLSGIGVLARAEAAAGEINHEHGAALVEWTDLGIAIGAALKRRGLNVAYVAGAASNGPAPTDERVYSRCPAGLEQAMREVAGGEPFGVLAAGLSAWGKQFDLSQLASKAIVIDCDDNAAPITATANVAAVVRTDMSLLLADRERMTTALAASVRLLTSGQVQPAPSLEVSITDIAWQKLPLADTKSALILNYDARGKDLPVVKHDRLRFDARASYLITGGLGGLGLKTAQWLADHGATQIVLTGRNTTMTAERQSFVASMNARGVQVHIFACDVADHSQVENLMVRIQQECAPLKGVFHSAAVIIDQPIAEIELDVLNKVMMAKAQGAWNLHQATRDIPLDHFVLYSSVANLVGNSRQAIYSAANGFLNGLAAMRRAAGLAGTSVNWGAISDVGVVAQDEKLEQFLRYTGLRGISSAEGLSLLKIALAKQLTQFGVTVITSWADWARFETRGCKSPRFATLIAKDSGEKDNSVKDALLAELAQLTPADQVELLATLMLQIIASVLKADPTTISIDQAIDQLGVDSLMATEIQLLLDTKLGLSISILELIGNTTTRSVATKALQSLFSGPSPAVPAAING